MELFKILGTIAIDNEGANDALDETVGKAEQTHSRLSGAFSKVGSAAVKVGKVMATGLTAGATAFGKLLKDSVDGFAEYEQLVGGVETLFEDLSWDVMQYANNAFKTAGLSANEYMETVTSFAATLNQSLTRLDGNIARSADMANLAITDMSDNANKMGTTMSAIQNAYQGFAKQNYSMLDNLKLGYGGTQEEMYRLLSDAKEIDESFDAVFSLDAKGHLEAEFADIIEAIHIIQTDMGITGTTAKEASSTIQGSVASMKSAWANFVTGMADDTQDFDALLGNLIDSVVTVANNLIPRIQILLPRLVEGVNQLITTLLPYIPGIIETLLPGIIEGAVALLTGLIVALPQILQLLIEQIPFILTQIGKALIQAFPGLLETVKNLFVQIWNYITEGLRNIGIDFEGAFDNIKGIFQDAWGWLKDVWENVGKPIFKGITDFIAGVFTGNWKKAWEGVKSVLTGIFNGILTGIETMINGGINAINRLIEGINKLVGKAGKALGLDVEIPTIPTVTLPKLEEGGVLEAGQVGLLEGNGAEAVVPLERNKKWISAVAKDMSFHGMGGGSDEKLQRIITLLEVLIEQMPDTMKDAFAAMKFDVNKREFARLVKVVE